MVGMMKKTMCAMRVNFVVNIYNTYVNNNNCKQRVGLTRPSFVPVTSFYTNSVIAKKFM